MRRNIIKLMSDTLKLVELIDNFKDYQINWLLGHNDIELDDTVEDAVVNFIKDTASCYINEIFYKDTETLEKVYGALKQIMCMAKSNSVQDRCFRNAVKFIQDAIYGKKSENYEDIYVKE